METAWIQIFVLALTECVAPAGKTVCQEQAFELQFVTEADCEIALEQLLTLKEASDTVIIDKSKASCAPSARQQKVYASLAEVTASVDDKRAWREPENAAASGAPTQVYRDERLDGLRTCEESKGVAPCRIGEIIIEAATEGESVEVWRRDQ